MSRIIALIPARYGSERLPGKPLLDICGKTLLERVWGNASRSSYLDRVVIATDDERIAEHCFNIGAEYVMTPATLPSGTDRIFHAYRQLEEDPDIIVNIQGDEPMLSSATLDRLIVSSLETDAHVTTIITKIKSNEELFNPSIVKVVLKDGGYALYFSRAVVPYLRDYPPFEFIKHHNYWKHIGIYAYKKEVFYLFNRLGVSDLENLEKLEQIRLLEIGAEFYCMVSDEKFIGVDTADDLEKVRTIFGNKMSYTGS